MLLLSICYDIGGANSSLRMRLPVRPSPGVTENRPGTRLGHAIDRLFPKRELHGSSRVGSPVVDGPVGEPIER